MDTPDAYKDLSSRVDTLTQMVQKLVEKQAESTTPSTATTPPVNKRMPIGDLAALITSQPVTGDPVLEAVISGDRNALLKAAQLAGTKEKPDIAAVNRKIDDQVNKILTPKFTRFMLAQGLEALVPDMK